MTGTLAIVFLALCGFVYSRDCQISELKKRPEVKGCSGIPRTKTVPSGTKVRMVCDEPNGWNMGRVCYEGSWNYCDTEMFEYTEGMKCSYPDLHGSVVHDHNEIRAKCAEQDSPTKYQKLYLQCFSGSWDGHDARSGPMWPDTPRW